MKVSSDMLYSCVYSDVSSFLGRDPATDAKAFAAEALLANLLKKHVGNKSSSADARALELFLHVNKTMRKSVETESLLDEYLVGQLKKELYDFWYPSSLDPIVSNLSDMFEKGKTGPGKSIGSSFNDFYTKLFNSRLTCSREDLYSNYRANSLKTPTYSDAEKLRSEFFGSHEIVGHNKMLFVPKRDDISRTICVEPSLNMFYQLGFGAILESRLRSFYSIDLGTQPDFNREMARVGSINGSYATIDLSSASDSLSHGVLREILPRDFLRWIEILRVPETLLPDGTKVALNMVSTMGNGFTFPLETIIFSAIVSACYKIHGLSLVRNSGGSHGNFAVFGDDIIVLKDVYPKVIRLLKLLGFTLNTDKTFVEGPFRESCGSDYFYGKPVRSVYIKSLLTPQDRYVAINLLNDWSAYTGIKLREAVQYLTQTVKRVLIPPFLGLDQGIHAPLSLSSPKYDRNQSFKIRCFCAKKRHFRVADDGSVRDRLLINPSGLVLAFISGHIRSHTIGFRQKAPQYVMKTVVAPFWDQLPFIRSYRRFSFAQWETTVYVNLYK